MFFILGCNTEKPPDSNEFATLVSEYDWIEGLDLREVFGLENDNVGIFGYVDAAFIEVGMRTYFHRESNRIPTYKVYDENYDFDYFPNDDLSLRQYAATYDNNNLY